MSQLFDFIRTMEQRYGKVTTQGFPFYLLGGGYFLAGKFLPSESLFAAFLTPIFLLFTTAFFVLIFLTQLIPSRTKTPTTGSRVLEVESESARPLYVRDWIAFPVILLAAILVDWHWAITSPLLASDIPLAKHDIAMIALYAEGFASAFFGFILGSHNQSKSWWISCLDGIVPATVVQTSGQALMYHLLFGSLPLIGSGLLLWLVPYPTPVLSIIIIFMAGWTAFILTLPFITFSDIIPKPHVRQFPGGGKRKRC